MESNSLNPATFPKTLGHGADSYLQVIPANQYHADLEILSCSMLKPMLVSPAHYIEAMLTKKRSAAMDHGTLLHTLVLEPHDAPNVMAVFPGSLKSPEGKQFAAQNLDRICISMVDLLLLKVAAEKVRRSLFRGRPFFKFIEEGIVEPGIYYTDPTTGLQCRIRPDLLHPEFTFDLKSSRHASAAHFQQDAVAMHYDLQSFMYSLARRIFEGPTAMKPFVFVKVESSAPHSVHFMPASKAFLENGYQKYAAAMAGIKACQVADLWPSEQGEVEMDLHPWQAYRANASAWSTPPALLDEEG